MQLENLTRRQAMRVIDGVSFPVIIRNGSYYLTNLMVFADGLIDCWETLDLPLFEEKLIDNWVQTRVPDGEVLSVSPLGMLEVSAGAWLMSEDDLFGHVRALIHALNPERHNLYDMHGSSTHKIDGLSYAKETRGSSPSWIPDDEDDVFLGRHKGHTIWAYERVPYGVDIVEISIFQNDCLTISGNHATRFLTFEAFKTEAADGRFDFPEDGETIAIKGLGRFVCSEAMSQGYSSDLIIGDLEESLRSLKGLPSLVALCRAAYDAYCRAPSTQTLADLKVAYDNVPSHLRRYCGENMDEKDAPIRVALYGNEGING